MVIYGLPVPSNTIVGEVKYPFYQYLKNSPCASQNGIDVGFPSVFCEYGLFSLVNKEAASAYGGGNIARQEK